MEISFSSYISADWPVLVATIDRFWDDLIAMDPYQRMEHPDEYGEVYSRELLARLAANEGRLVWAVADGKKVGFIAGLVEIQSEQNRVEVGQSKSGRILELFVEPSSRSRGVGAVLMREIEEYFMSLGCDTVKVEVFAPNAGALRFYRRLGYADWIVDLFKEIGLKGAENQTRNADAKK